MWEGLCMDMMVWVRVCMDMDIKKFMHRNRLRRVDCAEASKCVERLFMINGNISNPSLSASSVPEKGILGLLPISFFDACWDCMAKVPRVPSGLGR